VAADLGDPISYLVLETGADVYAGDGEKVGQVEEIRADLVNDIFDGLVIRHHLLGHRHLVTADQVDEIYERGVVLTLDSAAVEQLPPPD
jgi:uncharacterized protein YrrD